MNCPSCPPQLVVGVAGYVVKLIHRDQAVVKGLHPKGVHRKAESGMSTDQHLVRALQKGTQRLNLAAVVVARCIAEVPLGLNVPVGPKAILGQRFVVEAGANRPFRHHDDGLLQALVRQLVKGYKHQRPALAGSGWRLDQQVLFTPLLVRAFLHWAHAQGIGFG